MPKLDGDAIRASLPHYTGTEYWHRCALNPSCLYTDGVQFFVESAGAYWLLDILSTEFFELQHKAGFLSITLKVKDNQADLVIEDGDYNVLKVKHIDFTDCPEGDWPLFFTDNVILLRSEC